MNYYNEIDPYAAAWLRMLILEGVISDGIVDERSIIDIRPADLVGFRQCHFFAGIGVWSYALRLAGWPDDRPVWTGSCPCQPFSAAGKGGGFDDERHLWPAFYHLISQCRPPTVFGEQVASKDGLTWLDLVQADMEGAGYAFGAADLCAAGVGAPHIRQRLWFVADATAGGQREHGGAPRQTGHVALSVGAGRLGDDDDEGLEGQRHGPEAAGGRDRALRPVAEASESGGVADTENADRWSGKCGTEAGPRPHQERRWRLTGSGADGRPGPTNGFWRDADWLLCRDGKWRPVEPGTFPLAHGAAARVGRLRAYGNAIVAPVAQQMIEAYMAFDTDAGKGLG